MSRLHLGILLGFASIVVVTGCSPASTGAKDDPNPTAPTASANAEVDPHALCEIHAEVEDARYIARQGPLHARYLKEKSAPKGAGRAATFGAILTTGTEKKVWAAFRDENIANPGSVLFPLGECLVYAGWNMDDQAPPRCKVAKSQLDNLALADVALATMWRGKKDAAKAMTFADKALAQDPTCASAWIVKATLLQEGGDTAAAIAAWNDGLKVRSNCFVCAANKAILSEKGDDVAAAGVAWEAALAIVDDHGPSLERFAAILVGRDDAKALAAYEKAIAGGRPSYATLLAAAQLANRTNAMLKAIDYAEQAAQLEPDHVEQWRLLATLYEKRNEAEALEKAFQEVLRLLPEDRAAHLALSVLAEKEERFVDAFDHYASALSSARAEGSAATPEEIAAITGAQSKLHTRLHIVASVSGSPEVVQDAVRRTVQVLFKERHKPGTKGKITVSVKTFKSGIVEAANILEDSLKDPFVTASLLGNLKQSEIAGGRKLYEFEYEFR